MLIRSFTAMLIAASPFILATAQAPESNRDASKPAGETRSQRLRDIPFPGGVDLQYLIKELAKEMSINVLFDSESRLENRKARIELKNVTAAAALNYLLRQEGLVSEEVGPGTILVSSQYRATSIPEIGIGTTLLTRQLAQYFGVEGGLLINDVRDGSPGAKAGLKAGDVIVGIDGEPFSGVVGLARALGAKKESDIALAIVRERRNETIALRPTP